MATTANRRNTALKEAMTKPQLLETLSESTGLQNSGLFISIVCETPGMSDTT